MSVRPLTEADTAWVLALNATNVRETSPIDAEWVETVARYWLSGTAVGADEAFLIAFDQDAPYFSPNFLWFKERFERFAYVDRIVVSETARGKGCARALYEALFAAALKAGHDRVVCEVNVDPPNPVSDAFHERLGFSEEGRAPLANGKTVRYLMRMLP